MSTDPASGVVSGRIGRVEEFGNPAIKGRVSHTFTPRLPLEVPDGKDMIFWAVFVDEPPGNEAASFEERASRADMAWLFRIHTADEKK